MTRGKHAFSDEDDCADAPLHFGKLEIRGQHVIADDEILHELNGQSCFGKNWLRRATRLGKHHKELALL
jgi:hypothetical protein